MKNNNKVDFNFNEHNFFVEMISLEKVEKSSEKTGEKSWEKTSEKSWEKTSEKTRVETSEKTSEKIIELIKENPFISAKEIAMSIGKTPRAIEMQISKLKETRIIKRVGPDKGGYWKVIDTP